MSWQESQERFRLNDPARRLIVIGVMRYGRFRIIIVLACISVRRSVQIKNVKYCFLYHMALGIFVEELRMTPWLLTFTLVSNFMAVSVARDGSDTDGHLNLEDQLENAHYF